MSRTVFEYTTYEYWNTDARKDARYCVRAFRPDDDNIIDVYTADRKLLGFWDCASSYGELYSHV